MALERLRAFLASGLAPGRGGSALAVAAWLGLAAVTPAEAFVIDGFGAPAGGVSTPGAPYTYFNAPGVLGGTRGLLVDADGGLGAPSLGVNGAGELQFGAGMCTLCRGQVIWNSNGAGLNAANLKPDNAFELVFTALTAQVQVGITVVDEIGRASSLTRVVDAFAGPSFTSLFSYADFTDLGSGPTDFGLVDRVWLTFSSINPILLRLDTFGTFFVDPPPPPPGGDGGTTQPMPLPGTLPLVLAGLLAAPAVRRVGRSGRFGRFGRSGRLGRTPGAGAA